MEHGFLVVNKWLYDYAISIINRYGIDESHGIKHYFNVMNYAQQILVSEEIKSKTLIEGSTLSRYDVELVVLDAAFCHDLIDSKYVNEEQATKDLVNVLEKHNYGRPRVDILIYIIKNISYSKRIKRMGLGLPAFEDHPFKLVTQIVCDADQLDGYDVGRCILYQTIKHDHLQEPERTKKIRGWIRTILEKRILMYKDKHMNFEISKRLAIPLHEEANNYLITNLQDADLYDY